MTAVMPERDIDTSAKAKAPWNSLLIVDPLASGLLRLAVTE